MHLVLRFHFVTLLLLTIFAISRHCRYNLNVLIYFQCILIFIFYRSCGLIQIKMMMMIDDDDRMHWQLLQTLRIH